MKAVDHAIRSWTRRHSGTWTQSDESELESWLAATPEHRAAFDKVARVWATAGALERPRAVPLMRHRLVTRRALALCATVLIIALVVPTWQFVDRWWNGVPVLWSARRGHPEMLTLQDGTRVLLDADSELVVKLGARARRVSLRRGEALFTVVHDASRPFEVEIGPGRVTDLGTRFDVEMFDGSARVSVFEGRVGVATPHGEVVLTAGRSSGYDGSGTLLPVRTVEDKPSLSADGQRRFDAEPLSEVVERLARYHDVTFDFADPRLRQLQVSGVFRVSDLPLFLRTLSAAFPVNAKWTGPQRVEFTLRAYVDAGENNGARVRPDSPGQP